MKTIGNILWLIFFGWWLGLCYLIEGLIMCVTVIGIPIGLQLFKLAGFVVWPFGKAVKRGEGSVRFVLNLIWAILLGWENALVALVVGLICCITIIGMPVGLQMFKVAQFVIWPLGSTFVKA